MIEDRTYKLPTETIPSLSFSHILEDLVEFQKFLLDRGIQTKNTRIERYIAYLEQGIKGNWDAATKIFKNSVDGPFQHSTDWMLYVLREVHELNWILKGLKMHLPIGIDDKLRAIVSGRDFAALDLDSRSRDIQFELRIASYFCQTGCEVDVSQKTDVVALTDNEAFFIECKRVGSDAQLAKRLAEAKNQLKLRIPRRYAGRNVFGCVAADVTKVAFPHNGLTWAETSDHSKDILQDRLKDISSIAQKAQLYKDCRPLIFYWLQIHISALIKHPPTPTTRFSSLQIFRKALNRRELRAMKVFYGIFESASEDTDERKDQPQKLHRRDQIIIPAGSTFQLKNDLLNELLEDDESHKKAGELIGTLSFDGKDHEFYFIDFKMLSDEVKMYWKQNLTVDPAKTALNVLIAMYGHRFPYKDID